MQRTGHYLSPGNNAAKVIQVTKHKSWIFTTIVHSLLLSASLVSEGSRANINKTLKFNYHDNIADKT